MLAMKDSDMNTSGIMEIWLFGTIDAYSILRFMIMAIKQELYIE